MVKRYTIRVLAGAAIGAVALGACGSGVDKSGGKQVVKPVVVLHGINTRGGGEVDPFVEQVARLSKGSIALKLQSEWHSHSVTSEAEAIAAVRAGSVDFAVIPARAWDSAGVTSFDALIAPMTVDSYALQEAVLRDPMAGEMLAGVKKLNLTGIGILPGPMRKPAGVQRDLLAPKDFHGAKIAISPGAVAARSLRQLGATPVTSPFDGARMDDFDGLEQQLASITGNNYDGVVTTVTINVNLWPRPLVIVGNAKAVGALSNDQRQVLMSAAALAIPAATRGQVQSDKSAIQGLCASARLKFLAATGTQIQQLRDAFRPVNDSLARDERTRGYLKRIQGMDVGARAVSDATPDCPKPIAAPTTSPTAVKALDGRWTLSDSKVEYAAAHPEPGEDGVRDNWGTFALQLDNGRFTIANEDTGWRIEGDYTLEGDLLTLNVDAPADQFQYRVSTYKDTLTFARVDGGVSPTPFVVKAWTRKGGQ